MVFCAGELACSSKKKKKNELVRERKKRNEGKGETRPKSMKPPRKSVLANDVDILDALD